MARPSLDADLRRAGPLSDPVRFLSRLIIVNTVATAAIAAISVTAVVWGAASGGQAVLVGLGVEIALIVGSGVLPLAMWLLLAPGREQVFYLRAFRSDAHAAPVRRLIKTALGPRHRLCGIRPPRERVSWLWRLFLNGATGFRYLGTEQFELEASDRNWMPRLVASYAGARFVVVDVRDVTEHVAHEIALSYAAMGPARCVFLTDASQSEPAWRLQIAGFLEDASVDPDALRLLRYEGDSREQSDTFVRSTVALAREIPGGSPDVGRAVALVRARVPVERWPTPLLEKDWAQAVVGSVVLNGTTLVSYRASLVPTVIIGIVTLLFFVRAVFRTWREARLQVRFREIVGGRNPLRRPRIVAALSSCALVVAVAPAAIAIPSLLRARMAAMETSAIASLKTISSAEVLYSVSCGNGGYAPTLSTLGRPPAGATEGFISPDLGGSDAPDKSGYHFELHPGSDGAAGPADCNGKPTVTTWYATARPLTPGKTGSRAFGVDAENAIWQTTGGEPPRPPFGPPAVPLE